MTIKDAYEALAADGWKIDAVLDEDRKRSGSGGMSLAEAQNSTEYVVTRVEYTQPKPHPSDPTLISVPTCLVYYKSGGQDGLIQDYEFELKDWEFRYGLFLEWRESGESPDSLKEAVQEWYQEVFSYDLGLVPDMYKETHDQMVARAAELLASLE
jgi:hypothetical protein